MKFLKKSDEPNAFRFYHKWKFRGDIYLHEIPEDKQKEFASLVTRIWNMFIEEGK